MSPIPGARLHPLTAAEHRGWTWCGVATLVVVCAVTILVEWMIAALPARYWHVNFAAPGWQPPSWFFGSLWGASFLLTTGAAVVVWLARDRQDICCPLGTFAIQLSVSLAWPILLFGFGNTLLGFIAALILWVSLTMTLVQFFGVARPAGALMVPYWLWVTGAAIWNGSIFFTAN
jgi:translocator protein